MNLQTKTQKLLELRNKIQQMDKDYDAQVAPLKAERDDLNEDVMKTLEKSGQFSARFEFATVTRAVRKSIVIMDEKALVADLKKRGLTDYISEQPNELFESCKKEILKTGEVFAGLEINERNYISISVPEKDAERRKVRNEPYHG